jgi:hypothetical protein
MAVAMTLDGAFDFVQQAWRGGAACELDVFDGTIPAFA